VLVLHFLLLLLLQELLLLLMLLLQLSLPLGSRLCLCCCLGCPLRCCCRRRCGLCCLFHGCLLLLLGHCQLPPPTPTRLDSGSSLLLESARVHELPHILQNPGV